ANTYSGLTTVGAGVLQSNSAQALGGVLNGTVVAAGATLQLNPGAATTYAGENLTLSGAGYGNNGVLPQGALVHQAAQDNTWTGSVTLAADATVGAVAAANTLTLAGVVSGSAGLTKVGPGGLTLTNANTWTGSTTVQGGTLTLAGANAYAGPTTVSCAPYA